MFIIDTHLSTALLIYIKLWSVSGHKNCVHNHNNISLLDYKAIRLVAHTYMCVFMMFKLEIKRNYDAEKINNIIIIISRDNEIQEQARNVTKLIYFFALLISANFHVHRNLYAGCKNS